MIHFARKGSAVVLGVLALGAASMTAAVAAPGSNSPSIAFVAPTPAEGQTLSTSDASFAFTYNRQPKATQLPLSVGLVCTLSGPTPSSGPCDAPVASGSKSSSSGASYTDLADGSYTFTVALLLTDGGTATAERHFTVDAVRDRIFWSTYAGIGRADRDGTNVENSFTSGAGAEGIATDAQYIYWTNGNNIARTNLDGTGVDTSFITGGSDIAGVAVDANHIYWTNYGANGHLPPYGTIGRANLDGTGVDQAFMTGIINPEGIAVDGSYVYYSQGWNTQLFDGKIGRANLDGTGDNPNFIDTGDNDASSVVVDAGHVYWTNFYSYWGSPHTIGRANLDGTGVDNSFITTTGDPWGLAVDSDYVYWTIYNIPYDPHHAIGRANLDGTGVDNTFITGLFHPLGLALGTS